jgi:hypothetical protein
MPFCNRGSFDVNMRGEDILVLTCHRNMTYDSKVSWGNLTVEALMFMMFWEFPLLSFSVSWL